MKKYYVLEIADVVTDGTTNSSAGVYTYEDAKSAIGVFHQKLGGAMRNDNFVSDLICVLSSDGEIIKSEKYTSKSDSQSDVDI